MPTPKIIFGIFESGKLVYLIGSVFTATTTQAEVIACMLSPAFEATLPEGLYLAYDYAYNYNIR